MGFNPGGGSEGTSTILESLDGERRGWSAYTHDCWLCNRPADCDHKDGTGRLLPTASIHRHQRNVRLLLTALKTAPEAIFATNAIFRRSRDTAGLPSRWDWWARCWPVHQAFLSIVRPRWIICLGKAYDLSAFGFLRHESHQLKSAVQPCVTPDGKRDGRQFRAALDLGPGDRLDVGVLGTPHPSYHSLSPALERFIARQVVGVVQ
jgi:hypothetical protein